MTYKISVFKDREATGAWTARYTPWWVNFLESYNLLEREDDQFDDLLAEWNCKNIDLSDYIEFSSEADATFFLLRFS